MAATGKKESHIIEAAEHLARACAKSLLEYGAPATVGGDDEDTISVEVCVNNGIRIKLALGWKDEPEDDESEYESELEDEDE
jgi:hypothetical protein